MFRIPIDVTAAMNNNRTTAIVVVGSSITFSEHLGEWIYESSIRPIVNRSQSARRLTKAKPLMINRVDDRFDGGGESTRGEFEKCLNIYQC